MARKRDRPKAPARPYVAPEFFERISVPRATEEGLLIAKSALTMDVKNHVIVRALRDDKSFDADEIALFVREGLHRLAEDHAGYAKTMDKTAVAAIDATGPQLHGHDYRAGDYRALTQRATIYSAMSKELERLRADEEFVVSVVWAARDRAWDEISAAIESRLDWVTGPPPDRDYDNQRGLRLADLVMIDIAGLLHRSHPDPPS